jgi:hypothetical protein
MGGYTSKCGKKSKSLHPNIHSPKIIKYGNNVKSWPDVLSFKKTTRNSAPLNKNRSKLSEFLSEPFREKENNSEFPSELFRGRKNNSEFRSVEQK